MLEHLDPLTLQAESTVILALGVGFVRAMTGWLQKAKDDGVIESFEWKQLGATLLKYVAGGVLLGLGVDPAMGLAGIFGLDLVGDQVKRIKK